MPKIVLDVSMENLGSVVTVLNALKEGLIDDMQIEGSLPEHTKKKTGIDTVTKEVQKKSPRYQPRANRVVYEEEQVGLVSRGKYLDPKAFKERLRQRKGL